MPATDYLFFLSLSFGFNIINSYFFYFYFRERKTTITKFSISYFLNIPGLFSSISSFRWGCRRSLTACFLSFFVVCFRIQKERVSEREKDLEVLQEKLAEQVCHSLNYQKITKTCISEMDFFWQSFVVQDLELNETKRTEAGLKEEKGDAELEIKTLKR